ncbi:MAG: DUF4440 domain-containing protein [Gemmatimonadota bacterium]
MTRALSVGLFLLPVVAACSAAPAAEGATATTSVIAPADSAARDSAAHQAHANYVRVINSNKADSFATMVTDDVVFLASGEKPLVGKAAVRAWVDGYYKAYRTSWDKPVEELVVAGDYAYERYRWTSTDTPIAGGAPIVDTGWGLLVYRREADGVWRVARDAFGPDHPPAR